MVSQAHTKHVRTRTSYAGCPECRADCERQWTGGSAWEGYRYVGEYLAYVRPRLEAIRTGENGGDTLEGQRWYRGFIEALQRRIYLRNVPPCGRKHSAGYLERIWQFRDHATGLWWYHDGEYLRELAYAH